MQGEPRLGRPPEAINPETVVRAEETLFEKGEGFVGTSVTGDAAFTTAIRIQRESAGTADVLVL
ncbi:hypothetical protein Tcan_09310 [Toxocara canis]|uniref:Uncharacterized protein n=1 Tax=Toxocara canis TaxID=6265 RepID=A0A0B2VD25_TOXCA|nr:hypothetical protein Tcan_09310 [Toxocara canis]